MALTSPLTLQPYDYIGDSNGRPLDYGQIYIGIADKDPEFNQIPVYLDKAMTKLADQPLRTRGGFIEFAGDLTAAYASASVYSLKVLDKQGRTVFYKAAMMRNNLADDALTILDAAIADAQAQVAITSAQVVQDAINNVFIGENLTDQTVVTIPTAAGMVSRTQQEVNSDIVSIYDFYDGEPTFSPALQRSVASGRAVFFPSGDYVFKELVTINEPDFTVYGNGRMLWDSDGTAGSTCIHVQEDGFSSIGLSHECTTVRRAFYRVNNPEKDIKGFLFDRCDFKGGFYSVRGGLTPSQSPNTTKIHDMVVRGCTSDAPTDVPAGHYIMSNSVGTKYLGNICTGGGNTSVYGINFSSDFVIIGNTEKGVTAYQSNGAEASIQIEDSDLANGIIANNICSHDIWISGANEVQVHNNRCRTLRVSVGNPTGHSVYNTVFSNNKCTAISLAKYGTYTTTDTYSVVFKDTIVDPQFAVRLGRNVPNRVINIQGGDFGKDIKFKNTEVISSASQYQSSIIRGSILNLDLEDNDFGGGSNIQSGTGGIIRERAKYNPIFPEFSKEPLAAIGLEFTSGKVVGTYASWVKLTDFNVIKDINGAVSSESGIISLTKGVHLLNIKLLISVPTVGNTVGLRLVDQDGSEISRVIYTKASTTSSVIYTGSCSFRTTDDYMTASIEVFSEQSTTIVGSKTINTLSITPVS